MNKKRKRNINSELPSSIIEVIFTKLPFYNLPSCRIVCKEWDDLILASKFDPPISISSYFFNGLRPKIFCVDCDLNPWKGMGTVASFNFHPKLCSIGKKSSIHNACNSLLCLMITKKSNNKVCILNPMTNEYLKVPILKLDRSINYRCGLGFSPETKQYKIVIISLLKNSSTTLIQIYAFGTSGTNGQWKTIDFLSFSYVSHFVYFNGGLYFLVYHVSRVVRKGRVIYRLDVKDEKFSEIPSPSDLHWYSMVDFNDTIYLISCNCVWKMTEDFSWIKIFVLDVGQSFRTIKIFEDEKMLGIDKFNYVLYDPKTETKVILGGRNIKHHKKVMRFCHVAQFRHPLRISSNFKSLHKMLLGSG